MAQSRYEKLIAMKENQYRDREVIQHAMPLGEFKKRRWPVGTIWIGSLNGRVCGPANNKREE